MNLVTKKQIIDIIEDIAPQEYAINADNPGLQIGDLDGEVAKCLVCLDVTQSVLEEAIDNNVDLIVSHHPVIMEPLNDLSNYSLPSYIIQAIKHDLTIYSCHTNYDAAPKLGVNHALIDRLGITLNSSLPLQPSYEHRYYKLVVYVPKDYIWEVHSSVTGSGAGCLGNYSHVSFQSEGLGTFYPCSGSNPVIGQVDNLSKVTEIKLETIVLDRDLNHVINGMLAVHPYEEPAYDVYMLKEPIKVVGLGLAGELLTPISGRDLINKVNANLQTEARIAGPMYETISRLAVCGGSGGKLVQNASYRGIQALITGDVKYHEALTAREQNIMLIDAGHRETELPSIDQLANYINDKLGSGCKTEISVSSNQDSVFY